MEIMEKYFDMKDKKKLISPFFGGGSFEMFVNNKYNIQVIANDKFVPLYNFWFQCKNNNKELCEMLYDNMTITKNDFIEYRQKILDMENNIYKASIYFIINRCSFSGSTLSGGFSNEASKKRYTKSSIDKINKLDLHNFEFYNMDFYDFINKFDDINNIMFLDPPYYLENKSKLYGNNGDLHENFDHVKLYNILHNKKNWIMTYNNSSYILELYKNFTIIHTNWKYGMNKNKLSSEIVIISS